jgi:hypothetical protein
LQRFADTGPNKNEIDTNAEPTQAAKIREILIKFAVNVSQILSPAAVGKQFIFPSSFQKVNSNLRN